MLRYPYAHKPPAVDKLKRSGLLEGTRFKEGGHFFFSTLPNGNLAAEGMRFVHVALGAAHVSCNHH